MHLYLLPIIIMPFNEIQKKQQTALWKPRRAPEVKMRELVNKTISQNLNIWTQKKFDTTGLYKADFKVYTGAWGRGSHRAGAAVAQIKAHSNGALALSMSSSQSSWESIARVENQDLLRLFKMVWVGKTNPLTWKVLILCIIFLPLFSFLNIFVAGSIVTFQARCCKDTGI